MLEVGKVYRTENITSPYDKELVDQHGWLWKITSYSETEGICSIQSVGTGALRHVYLPGALKYLVPLD